MITIGGIQFPEISQLIADIRAKQNYPQEAQKDPEHLNICLQIAAIWDRWLKNSPWESFIPLVRLLASQYRKITYGDPSSIPDDAYVERALGISDCINSRLFTNEGTLHLQASQRAWRAAVLHIVRFPREDCEEQRGTLQYLLPSGPHPLCPDARDTLLPEDQSYFARIIRSEKFLPEGILLLRKDEREAAYQYPLHSFGMNLLLSKFSLQATSSRKKAILTAIHINYTTFALKWMEGFDWRPLSEEIENWLVKSLNRLDTKLSDTILSLLSKRPLQLSMSRKLRQVLVCHETLLHLAVYDGCETLSHILLDQIKFSFRALHKALLLAVNRGFSSVVEKLVDHPDMDDQGRGEALYIAARYDPQKALKILSSRPLPESYRGAAMCSRAEQNDTQSVQLLWSSGPTLIEHQNEVLYWAAQYGNVDLVKLRLQSELPLTDAQRIKAIRIAKKYKQSTGLMLPLLRPSYHSQLGNIPCFPNYPSSMDAPYYFKTITTEQLMNPSLGQNIENAKLQVPLSLLAWTPECVWAIHRYRTVVLNM